MNVVICEEWLLYKVSASDFWPIAFGSYFVIGDSGIAAIGVLESLHMLPEFIVLLNLLFHFLAIFLLVDCVILQVFIHKLVFKVYLKLPQNLLLCI